jgi:hypothetical protein
MDAFREGLATVLPLGPLLALDPLELRALPCGTLDIEWEEAELQRHIHPAGGLTREMHAYRCARRDATRCDATTRRDSTTRAERAPASASQLSALRARRARTDPRVPPPARTGC